MIDGYAPSKYQQAFYDRLLNTDDNIILEAVAGSGKTSTIVNSLSLLPRTANVLFCAFNKHIAEELAQRAPINVSCMTLNSFGFNVLKAGRGYAKVSDLKTQDILYYDVFRKPTAGPERKQYRAMRSAVTKMVALLKAHVIIDPTVEDLGRLEDQFSISCNIPYFEQVIEVHKLSMQRTSKIDFDDQIFLPLVLDLPTPQYEYVFVDEAQDLNPAQIDLVYRAAKRGIFVGDTRQAIYGFRGADPYAMSRIQRKFNCTELPLSISYRCSRAVVAAARKIVPDIEHSDTAPQGDVGQVTYSQYETMVNEGDYVLCRTTAPVVRAALARLRQGKRATVRGKAIGELLVDMSSHVDDLDAHEAAMRIKYAKKPTELDTVLDQIDTLRALIDAFGLAGLADGVAKLFNDHTYRGVVYSTVHRAKGHECNTVFLLHPELLPHPKATLEWQLVQEENLRYIAITRARVNYHEVVE